MNLASIISPERVQFHRDINSKKRALEEISRLLASGAPGTPETSILGCLAHREKLGSTGMEGGVAIPHGRLAGIDRCVGAFLRIDGGVDFESRDAQKTDLIFGLLVPQDSTDEHLDFLRQLAELFLDEKFCTSARNTQDPKALHQLLIQSAPAAAA
jgi:PTS system nitrogen regulatory IIA component